METGNFDEVERVSDAVNARVGWTRDDADRIILTPMGGGTV